MAAPTAPLTDRQPDDEGVRRARKATRGDSLSFFPPPGVLSTDMFCAVAKHGVIPFLFFRYVLRGTVCQT